MSMVLSVLGVRRGVAQCESLTLFGACAGSTTGGHVHFANISVPLLSPSVVKNFLKDSVNVVSLIGWCFTEI